MERLDVEIMRTELEGVPVYWAEAPAPMRAALVFRVGRADETLATAGLTHLVEHLAFFGLDLRRSQFGGFVDQTRTVFHASGTGEETMSFLARVSAALAELPFERLELEKQVLRTEEASSSRSSWQTLMSLRYGAAGYGLVDYEELGLRRVQTEDVARWASERFTRGNAAVWLSGPPPSGLEFGLAPGRRFGPPEPAPLPQLELPAHAARGSGGVTASFVGERSTALTTAVALLEERVHRRLRLDGGLSYYVAGTYVPLTAGSAHITLGADCLDEHATVVCAGILTELERLAAEGPDVDELAALVAERRAAFEEPSYVMADLDAAARNDLLGAPFLSRDELAREFEELTPGTVAEAVSRILPTALVLAPVGSAPQQGFTSYGAWPTAPLEGKRYKRHGQRSSSRSRASRVVFSPEGISLAATKTEEAVSVRFSDVVAVLRLGPGRMTVIDSDGSWIRLDLLTLVGGKDLQAAIEGALPAELFISCEDEPGGNVLDLAREKLGYRTKVATEIGAVQSLLAPGERVLNLAQVQRKMQRGLLVLTDRRLLYLSKGFTGRGKHQQEFKLEGITRVAGPRLITFGQRIVFTCEGKKTKFGSVTPAGRAPEFVRALREQIAPPSQS